MHLPRYTILPSRQRCCSNHRIIKKIHKRTRLEMIICRAAAHHTEWRCIKTQVLCSVDVPTSPLWDCKWLWLSAVDCIEAASTAISQTHTVWCAALMWIPTVVWVIILSSPRAEQEIFTMRIFMMLFLQHNSHFFTTPSSSGGRECGAFDCLTEGRRENETWAVSNLYHSFASLPHWPPLFYILLFMTFVREY